MDPTRLEGLIPLLGGIYGLLLAKGVLPRKPLDREKLADWRTKYGKVLSVVCPLVVAFGGLQLLGVL